MVNRFKMTANWRDGISPGNWINNTQQIVNVYDRKTGRYETAAGRTQDEAYQKAVEKHLVRELTKKYGPKKK